jgi:hypothetical protein
MILCVPRVARFMKILLLGAIFSTALLGAATPDAEAQSSFYLTFERSFSTNEDVQLRLDYTAREKPFHLRVLRPKSIETFLEGQLSISRSYEEPRAAINPGHFLAAGINNVSFPLQSFRQLLGVEFRQGWNGLLSPPLRDGGSGDPYISTPKRVVHEPPAGFEVAKDIRLDMQRGGTTPDDTWWWFFDQAPETGSFTVRTISLGTLPSGIYLVQVVQEDDEAQALLQVSEISLQVKQSTRSLSVRAVHRDGSPASGATVSVREAGGKWSVLPGTTDANGHLLHRSADKDLDGRLIVKAQTTQGITAFSDTDFVSLQPAPSTMFVSTDRPIFRPGEEVGFKAVLRDSVDGALVLPKSGEVKASLLRQDGTTVGEFKDLKVSEFGSLSGNFQVGEEDAPGLYRIVASVSGKPYAGELRVRDYVKPTFYMELSEHSGALRPGQKFSYTLKATRYAGGSPQGARYEAFVYRKKFTVPQFVEESGGGLSTGTDYFGGTQFAGTLAQPQRIYSSIEARTPEDERDSATEAWNTAPTFDALGLAKGEIELPPIKNQNSNQEWTYTVLFRALDRSGSQAVVSEDFFQTVAPGVVSGKFSRNIAHPGDEGVHFNVRVTTPEGVGLEGVSGTAVVNLKTVSGTQLVISSDYVTKKNGYAVLEIPKLSHVGLLEGFATATGAGKAAWSSQAKSERAELLVVGEQGEAVRVSKDVALYADSTILSPGEKTKVYAILPDGWGSNDSGTLWRTVAGDKVFESSGVAVSGRSYAFDAVAKEEYGTGFFETVTAPLPDGKFREGTLGFRIIPWKKRLKVSILPEKEVGEPMKPFLLKAQIRGADDKPVAGVEVAIGVVDRAVYAVQPEFRPNIVDFFFPMPRLNLMTFYSDELQGYGYASTIREPNFSLTAIKSQTKLSKRSVRDTAGWYPHLVTDQNGEVSISVPMPGNLTEWLVTATAVDKGGRVGEGQGKFRTSMDIEVAPRTPQFLTQGDALAIPVVLHSQLDKPTSLLLSGTAKQGALEIGVFPEQAINLSAKGEAIREMDLHTKGGEEPALLNFTASSSGGARVGGPREFEVDVRASAQPLVLSSTAVDSPNFGFTLPAGAAPQQLSITVTRGLLGVILDRARDLVTYPYGCAEQLSHTILPNVALLQMVEAVPGLSEDFGEFAPLVRKARSNVSIGLKKLLAFQKPNGGFSLWPSDPEPSPAVTLLVASVLQKISAAGVDEGDRAMWKASSWLEKESKRSSWSGYELVQLSRLNSSNDVTELQSSFVRNTATNNAATLADVVYAMMLVQRYQSMSWHSFNTQLADIAPLPILSAKLTTLLARPLEGVELDAAAFSPEPLGFGPGRTQLLGAALEVLQSLDPIPATLVRKVKNQVVADVRDGYVWSPFDSAELISSILPTVLEEIKSASEENGPLEVSDSSGQALLKLNPIRGGFAGKTALLPDATVDLSKLKVSGISGTYSLVASLNVDVPFSTLQELNQGVSVSRTLHKIVSAGTVLVPEDGALNVGDVVVSKVEVTRLADRRRWFNAQPSDWFVVQDGVPSSAESLDDDKTYLADAKLVPAGDTYWSQVKETLRYPAHVDRVVRLLPGATFTSYSVWRVGFKGTSVVAPARAFNMYAKGLEGSSAARVITSK